MKSFASFSQIVAFVKIAETGSLSKAARDLSLTPSALSKSLTQLEARMGVLLVKRTTRSLVLTERGQDFYDRALNILGDIENAIDQADRFKKHPMGTLRLTSSVAFGCTQLTPMVNRYMDHYPDVDVQISLNDKIVNLAEENYDIALRITTSTDWVFAARKLAPIYWVYCASASYLERYGTLTTPDDLAKHKCLVYPAMTTNGAWSFQDNGNIRQVKVRGRLESNSSLVLLTAALDGQGIACLPTYVASQSIKNGSLQTVLPTFCAASSHTLYAMYFHSKYRNPLIRSFIDFIVDHWENSPPWDEVLE